MKIYYIFVDTMVKYTHTHTPAILPLNLDQNAIISILGSFRINSSHTILNWIWCQMVWSMRYFDTYHETEQNTILYFILKFMQNSMKIIHVKMVINYKCSIYIVNGIDAVSIINNNEQKSLYFFISFFYSVLGHMHSPIILNRIQQNHLQVSPIVR